MGNLDFSFENSQIIFKNSIFHPVFMESLFIYLIDLNLISQMMINFEHHCMCLFIIHISSLVKEPKFFAIFKDLVVYFLFEL